MEADYFVNYSDVDWQSKTCEVREEEPQALRLLGPSGSVLIKRKERIGFAHPKVVSRILSS